MHRRALERVLSDRLDETPVVRISGPRAAGKTTSCVAETVRRGGSIVRLDDPDERQAALADPTGYLAGLQPPVLIDEYQRAPVVLDVIKTRLSAAPAHAGQWLLSGSVSVDAVASAHESLGGRLTDVKMGTLTLDERNDLPEPRFLTRALADGPESIRAWRPTKPFSREYLLAEAVRSGFPLVADHTSGTLRRRGLDDWVNASVVADGAAVGGVRDVESLRRMLRLYASATASIQPKDSPVAEQLELNRRTVARYRDLFASLYVTWDLPAFVPGNATGQVVKSPKIHLIDAGLAAALTGRDGPSALDRDPRFAGALVETMVANDLRIQASVHDTTPRLFHYHEDTYEVDVVIETGEGLILGIEVKLASNPGDRDLNGLRRLRRSSGSRWAGGIVLCRAPVGRITDDGLVLAPIEALWQVQ